MELTKVQKQVIDFLSESPLKEKFYWTGGTLLAYHYLHHRKSEDLDFFAGEQFSFEDVNSFVQQVKEKIDFKKVSYRKIFERHEFFLENQETLRIEFVYYNHEKKTLKKRGKLLGISIDSLDDIAANKVMAYFDRNEPKDLYDIYFLLTKSGFRPKNLLDFVNAKFGVRFDESSFWSEAFKIFPLLQNIKPVLLEEDENKKQELLYNIKKYFKDKSANFLGKSLE